MDNTDKIRELNDKFRTTFKGGDVVTTRSIHSLGVDTYVEILNLVRLYDDFDSGNDPYQEHDFGSFTYQSHKIFWKIDYYDLSYEFGSENPKDTTITRRVLTVMLASEY